MPHNNISLIRIAIGIIIINGMLQSWACKSNINQSDNSTAPRLCYTKPINGKWEIFTNDIDGKSPENISNSTRDDEYPVWSPDGRYIMFNRDTIIASTKIMVYDTQTKKLTNITEGSGGADQEPTWTADGRACVFCALSFAAPRKTLCLINPDGSNLRKVMDFPSGPPTIPVYFYANSQRFLYVMDSKVYRANITGTENEFVFDPSSTSSVFYTIRDFNPHTGRFLVNTNAVAGSESAIAEYDIDSKQLFPRIRAEKGYTLVSQRYSNDYQRIAFVEIGNDSAGSHDEYLSVYEQGMTRRLAVVHFGSQTKESFSWVPMQFSPDNRYIAYSVVTWGSRGDMLSLDQHLYVIDVLTKEIHHVDRGQHASWNPNP